MSDRDGFGQAMQQIGAAVSDHVNAPPFRKNFERAVWVVCWS